MGKGEIVGCQYMLNSVFMMASACFGIIGMTWLLILFPKYITGEIGIGGKSWKISVVICVKSGIGTLGKSCLLDLKAITSPYVGRFFQRSCWCAAAFWCSLKAARTPFWRRSRKSCDHWFLGLVDVCFFQQVWLGFPSWPKGSKVYQFDQNSYSLPTSTSKTALGLKRFFVFLSVQNYICRKIIRVSGKRWVPEVHKFVKFA